MVSEVRVQRNAWGWPMVGAGAAMFVVAALGGCPSRPEDARHASPSDPAPGVPDHLLSSIYDRASVRVARGTLYRPSSGGEVPARVSEFAPLFVRRSGDDVATTDGLVVRASIGSVRVGEREFEQITYRWSREEEPNASLNGIRVTIDANGFPVIYEVVEPERGMTLLFVSKSVEEAAHDAHGPPLHGRRYAVEQSVSDRPAVVVARVIEDGPQPMGPIVYLSPDGVTVETLICRCMPSQVDELVASETYPLIADDAAAPPSVDVSIFLRLPAGF